jgi:hypothetical protein
MDDKEDTPGLGRDREPPREQTAFQHAVHRSRLDIASLDLAPVAITSCGRPIEVRKVAASSRVDAATFRTSMLP